MLRDNLPLLYIPLLATATALMWKYIRARQQNPQRLPLPPGPPGKAIAPASTDYMANADTQAIRLSARCSHQQCRGSHTKNGTRTMVRRCSRINTEAQNAVLSL
jgi:hypothetical protein